MMGAAANAQDEPSQAADQADIATAQVVDESLVGEGAPPVERNAAQTTWFDEKRYDAKDYLNKTDLCCQQRRKTFGRFHQAA